MTRGKHYSLYKRNNIYYSQFKLPDGKWSTAKSTGLKNKNKAETWCIEYLQRGGIVIKENVTLKEFSKDFFHWENTWATDKRVRGLRISPRHCLERTDLLNNHLIPALGDVKLTAIDKAIIKDFRNKLYNEDYSGSTINKILSTLKAILEDAEEKNLIQYIPKIDRAAENPKQKGILTIEEVKRLFSVEWLDLRGYVGNLLAASTGLRLGELQALTLEDLHLDNNYIHVRRSWDKRFQTFTATTKTGRARNIFIPENIKNEIIRLIEINPYEKNPETFLFFAEKLENKPAEPVILTRALYRRLENIGIHSEERESRNISFHSWRHWLNSLLINSKIPLQKIQSITGHLTTEMSQHYYKLDDMADVLMVTDSILKTQKSI